MPITGEYDAPLHITGSTVALQSGTRISSVINSTPSSLLTGSSIFGQLPGGTATLGSVAAIVSNFPTTQNVSGSVMAFQGTSPWITIFNNSSILATQQGTRISSVVNSAPSSLLTGSSIFGQLPAGTATLGSVVAYQGVPSWNIGGSVLAQQMGTNISSVVNSNPSSMLVGNYGHRNDAIASFLGGNLTWNPVASDSAGRVITKPFSSDDNTLISYVSSLTTTSVTLLVASVIGKRNYVTDFWLANTGAAATRVVFRDGGNAILAETMVGAGTTTNVPGINVPFKTAVSQNLTLSMGTSTSMLLINVRGYQAP